MYCTPGDIRDVLSWFRHKRNSYKWLIILAAGHQNDAETYEQIFNAKETIHVITGAEIAVVMFYNGTTMTTAFQAEAEGHVLPCKMLHEDHMMNARLFPITNLPQELDPSNIISTSQTICNRICSYFDISFSQLPAILIFDKDWIPPLIIPTKGVSDVKHFITLIKDMRESLEKSSLSIDEEINSLNHLMSLETRIYNERVQKIDSLRSALQGYKVECENLAKKISRYIENQSGSSEPFQEMLQLNNAHDLNKKIDTRSSDQGVEEALIKHDNLNIILTDKQWKLCRSLSHMAQKYKDAKFELESFEHGQYKGVFVSSKDIEKLEEANKAYMPEILRLAEKYEKHFKLHARLEAVKQFVSNFFGYTKRAKELLSLQEKIEKLAGPKT